MIIEKILTEKMIAISRGIASKDMPRLAEALITGGVHCLEITFDQASEEKSRDTLKSIQLLRERYAAQLLIGAGTVMRPEQVYQAADAGAQYIISPNLNLSVIHQTKELNLISIPGALTPTEAAAAYDAGADFVKLFPAAVLGAAYIKALTAPLNHIRFLAVGGINPQNCQEFIRAGAVGVGCGGNLANPALIKENRLAEIVSTAQAYREALG